MIIKMLSDNEDLEYKRMSEHRKLNYHILMNKIDKEVKKYILAIDINEESGICQLVKMCYGDNGCLIVDSVERF